MNCVWSEEEINFIINYYDGKNIKELSEELDKTIGSIKTKIVRLRKKGLMEKREDKYKDLLEDERLCSKCNEVFKEPHMAYRRKKERWNICRKCANEHSRLKEAEKREKKRNNEISDINNIIEIEKKKMHTCIRCEKEMLGENFYFNSKTGKKYSYCKKCNLERNKERELKRIKGEN